MNVFIRWPPSFVWMAVIYYFSSLPTVGVISTDPIARFYIYKSFHLIEYAILGCFLLFASRRLIKAVPLAYLYACTDEIHQYLTSVRTGKFSDTLIDLVGILFGVFIYKYFKNKYSNTFKWL